MCSGADDFLPLFCYILVQANMESLFSEINLLQDFCEEETLLGKDGTLTSFHKSLTQR